MAREKPEERSRTSVDTECHGDRHSVDRRGFGWYGSGHPGTLEVGCSQFLMFQLVMKKTTPICAISKTVFHLHVVDMAQVAFVKRPKLIFQNYRHRCIAPPSNRDVGHTVRRSWIDFS